MSDHQIYEAGPGNNVTVDLSWTEACYVITAQLLEPFLRRPFQHPYISIGEGIWKFSIRAALLDSVSHNSRGPALEIQTADILGNMYILKYRVDYQDLGWHCVEENNKYPKEWDENVPSDWQKSLAAGPMVDWVTQDNSLESYCLRNIIIGGVSGNYCPDSSRGQIYLHQGIPENHVSLLVRLGSESDGMKSFVTKVPLLDILFMQERLIPMTHHFRDKAYYNDYAFPQVEKMNKKSIPQPVELAMTF